MRRHVSLRRAPAVHGAAALLLAFGASCQGIANLDENYVLQASTASASSSGVGGAGTGGARACPPDEVPAIEPAKPASATPGGDIAFAVALQTVDFGEKAPGQCDVRPLPGFNLDGVASTEAMPACQAPCATCYKQCDGREGVDNLLAQLVGKIALVAGVGSDDASKAASEGKWSLLVVVRDYNGEVDDESVRVEMYTSSAFGPQGPTWTGTDDWPIDTTSVDAEKAPLFASDYGWVSCGLLVASIPAIPIRLNTDSARMSLTLNGGRIVARVLPQGNGQFALEGAVGGLWKQGQIWNDLASFRGADGAPICTTHAFFGHVKSQVCPALDATAGFASPSAPCDAMSVGVGFVSKPIKLPTRIQEPAMPVNADCPAATLPGPDTCMQ